MCTCETPEKAVSTNFRSSLTSSLALALNTLVGSVRLNLLEAGRANLQPCLMTKHSPFRYLKTSPEVIRLAVMMYVRFPLSLRNVEDLLHERGVDVCRGIRTLVS